MDRTLKSREGESEDFELLCDDDRSMVMVWFVKVWILFEVSLLCM